MLGLQSAHEGNKMDVIGSFDHSFIIELRRERLHAMLQLFEQTIRANATEESPRIGFELDSNGKWDPSFLGKNWKTEELDQENNIICIMHEINIQYIHTESYSNIYTWLIHLYKLNPLKGLFCPFINKSFLGMELSKWCK